MPYGVKLIDQTYKVSNNRDLETKEANLLHYLDHLLFIPEAENAEKGHIKQIHQVKNLRPIYRVINFSKTTDQLISSLKMTNDR